MSAPPHGKRNVLIAAATGQAHRSGVPGDQHGSMWSGSRLAACRNWDGMSKSDGLAWTYFRSVFGGRCGLRSETEAITNGGGGAEAQL